MGSCVEERLKGRREIGTFVPRPWECEVLWKAACCFLKKLKTELSSLTCGCIPQRIESRVSQRSLHTHVHSGTTTIA